MSCNCNFCQASPIAFQICPVGYSPDSRRLIPAPVSTRVLMSFQRPVISRTYPAAIRRSLWALGIVYCSGLLPTAFNETNSSGASENLNRDKYFDWYRTFVILLNVLNRLVTFKLI